jgi:hypothetical protein
VLRRVVYDHGDADRRAGHSSRDAARAG